MSHVRFRLDHHRRRSQYIHDATICLNSRRDRQVDDSVIVVCIQSRVEIARVLSRGIRVCQCRSGRLYCNNCGSLGMGMVRQERNLEEVKGYIWEQNGTLLPMIGTEGKVVLAVPYVVLAVTSDSIDVIVDV